MWDGCATARPTCRFGAVRVAPAHPLCQLWVGSKTKSYVQTCPLYSATVGNSNLRPALRFPGLLLGRLNPASRQILHTLLWFTHSSRLSNAVIRLYPYRLCLLASSIIRCRNSTECLVTAPSYRYVEWLIPTASHAVRLELPLSISSDTISRFSLTGAPFLEGLLECLVSKRLFRCQLLEPGVLTLQLFELP